MQYDPKKPDEPRPHAFPELPIITVDPAPRLSVGEKYGGLYYLGIGGLAVVVALVGWFGYAAWTLRDVWRNVYILHDGSRAEVDRIRAAYDLSRDSRVGHQQRWDICLRRPLPPLGRYMIAESLTTETVRPDPDLFAKIVANSEDWPGWLRLLGVRLMAVAAAEGIGFPAPVLDKLAAEKDPDILPFVDYIRAVSSTPDREAAARLKELSQGDNPVAPLAKMLAAAIEAGEADRAERLEEATLWLRTHDPAAATLWKGWTVRGGELSPTRP